MVTGVPSGAAKPAGGDTADAVSALVNLGYKENQAKKVLESMEIATDTPLEDILKEALKVLAK